MFSIYKSHQKHLYSKLVELSRNIFFYKKIQLKDNFETRIKLIFLHLSLILIIFREKNKDNFPQDVFDNIFLNIEYHIRELGYGDVAVNKKMKELLKIFYDILLNLRLPKTRKKIINKNVIKNYLELHHIQQEELSDILADYFEQFYYFCFEIENNSVVKGKINFKF
jgi:cytochrome b pre-mRNA-processing protein 3